jgi:hypothetical protein
VGDLEALEAIAALSLFTNDVKDGVNEFSTFGVVALSPVVTGTSLSEDEVVWAEELAEGTSTNGVHGAWLKIHKNGSWHITATGGFVEVDVDSLQLKVRVSVVRTSWVNTMLVGDDFPELGTDLVTALATLYVNDFAHPEVFVLNYNLRV